MAFRRAAVRAGLVLANKYRKKYLMGRNKARRITLRRPLKSSNVVRIRKIKQFDRDLVAVNAIESGTYTFQAIDFPQYGDYFKLYEYFRIDKVILSFRAMNNSVDTSNITGANGFCTNGRIHTIIDFNDNSAPAATRAGIQLMMQDPTYRCTSSTRNHVRALVPKVLLEVGGGSVGGISKGKQWIPTGASTSTLNHYGVKYVLEGGYSTAGANAWSYAVEPTVTLYMSFKDPIGQQV